MPMRVPFCVSGGSREMHSFRPSQPTWSNVLQGKDRTGDLCK